MANEFQIPNDPTMQELNQSLIICANNKARLGKLISEYKTNVAYKTTALKRTTAKATVKHSNAKNSSLIKALAENDEDVIKAQDELDAVSAIYTVAMAEYDGYEAQFVALRKIANMKVEEMRNRLA